MSETRPCETQLCPRLTEAAAAPQVVSLDVDDATQQRILRDQATRDRVRETLRSDIARKMAPKWNMTPEEAAKYVKIGQLMPGSIQFSVELTPPTGNSSELPEVTKEDFRSTSDAHAVEIKDVRKPEPKPALTNALAEPQPGLPGSGARASEARSG